MHLLIPAAGSGRRMGSDRNKLLLSLLDQPLLAWTLRAIKAAPTIRWVGIIGQSQDFAAFQEMATSVDLPQPLHLIQGGSTRQESVFNGLQALPLAAEQVLIHDGARCLATPDLFERCAAELRACAGLIAAIPVKDTIKIVDDQQMVADTPNRDRLWAAQTPQGFQVAQLRTCHLTGKQKGWEVTDDAMLFEQCGFPVKIVPGEETNLKVTTPMDLAIAEFILRQRLA